MEGVTARHSDSVWGGGGDGITSPQRLLALVDFSGVEFGAQPPELSCRARVLIDSFKKLGVSDRRANTAARKSSTHGLPHTYLFSVVIRNLQPCRVHFDVLLLVLGSGNISRKLALQVIGQ